MPEYYHHRVATFLENYLDAPDACTDIVAKFDVLVLDVLREKEAWEKKREKAREEAREIQAK